MVSAQAPSQIAASFTSWRNLNDRNPLPPDADEEHSALERAILFHAPKSDADIVLMLQLLLEELAGERSDGGDLFALRSIQALLLERTPGLHPVFK